MPQMCGEKCLRDLVSPQGGEVWQVVVLLVSGWGGVVGGGVAGARFSSC